MRRPSPLEIQDALYGGGLRVFAYAAAAVAIVVFFAPWEVNGRGLSWTWDLWSGSEAFFLIPAVGGVVLAVLSGIESVPGLVVGTATLVVGLAWALLCGDQFDPLFGPFDAGAPERATLAAIAVPVLLAGLAWRRALHRSLIARLVIALGALGTIALFAVPLGSRGSMLFQVGVLDRIADGAPASLAAAAPLVLVLLGAAAALTTLLSSPRGSGGLSTLSAVLLHVVAAALAFTPLFAILVALGDLDLGYGLFAVPLKLGALLWLGLVWVGMGAGTAAGALEARLRPQASPARPVALAAPQVAPSVPHAVATGSPVALPPPVAPVAAPSGPDLTPLPPPPGVGGLAFPETAPAPLPSHVAGNLEELLPQHALPLLDPAGEQVLRQDEPTRPVWPSDPLAVAPPARSPAAASSTEPTAPIAAPPGKAVSSPRIWPPPAAAPPAALSGVPSVPETAPAPGPAAATAPPPHGTRPSGPGASPTSYSLGAPRSPLRARTMLGMPPAAPRAADALPDGGSSGRTGDTSRGLPTARPPVPRRSAPPPSATAQPEVSGLRGWPPSAGQRRATGETETPVLGVTTGPDGDLRDTPLVIPPDAGTRRRTATPAPVRPAEPSAPAVAGSSDNVRHRISALQRQLARGEITPSVYQRRLDELLKPGR